WGTWVLNACPLYPSAETVCCCEYTDSRLAFWEPTSTALDERTGAMRFPVTVPSIPSMNTSSRRTWGLYDVQFRRMSPSLGRMGRRSLALCGRRKAKQPVMHDGGHQ